MKVKGDNSVHTLQIFRRGFRVCFNLLCTNVVFVYAPKWIYEMKTLSQNTLLNFPKLGYDTAMSRSNNSERRKRNENEKAKDDSNTRKPFEHRFMFLI